MTPRRAPGRAGWPKTASVSPTTAEPRPSDGWPRPGTVSTARSRTGSKAVTDAGSVRPSGRSTSVLVVPATTWALVTMVSGAGEKPLPCSRSPQATPLTLTVEAVTWETRLGPMPGRAGAGIGTSRARRPLSRPRRSAAGAAAGRVRPGAACAGPAVASIGNASPTARTMAPARRRVLKDTTDLPSSARFLQR